MDDLFGKGNDPKERQPKVDAIDFDSFVEKVKLMSFEAGQMVLWAEVYKLPRWHFVLKQEPNEDIKSVVPFIGEVERKGWFFAFTDGKHARKFAERQKFVNEDGSAFTVAMEPLEAAKWMSEYGKKGIYGVRFNEGEHGWFAPIENLLPMYKRLKELKKI